MVALHSCVTGSPMPRTHGFQCQMVQLPLKGSFLTSKKLFSNKSPFIAMPVSSHAEVLKHLGSCLLNVAGPSATAFQQNELCLSLPSLRSISSQNRPYLPPPPYVSFPTFHVRSGRNAVAEVLFPEGSSSDHGDTRRALAGTLFNTALRGTGETDLVI